MKKEKPRANRRTAIFWSSAFYGLVMYLVMAFGYPWWAGEPLLPNAHLWLVPLCVAVAGLYGWMMWQSVGKS
jgi:hypothetical protein